MGLPHPRVLKQWHTVVDGDPGFNNQAFSAYKEQVKKNKKEQKTTIVSAMFDEITITNMLNILSFMKLEWS